MKEKKKGRYKALIIAFVKLVWAKVRKVLYRLVATLSHTTARVLKTYYIKDDIMYQLEDGTFVIFSSGSLMVMRYDSLFHMELPEVDVKDLLMRDSMTEEEYDEAKRQEAELQNGRKITPEVLMDFDIQVKMISTEKLHDLLRRYEMEEDFKKCAIIKEELKNRN